MSPIPTKYRSSQEELMDDFDLRGAALEKTLKDLDQINSWLGGNKITLDGIHKIMAKSPSKPHFRIIDLGCGNGTLLQKVADLGRKNKWDLELIGIDANPFAIEIAEANSTNFPEISFQTINVFSEVFSTLKADIFLCTLTLHHFAQPDLENLLLQIVKNTSLGVVVNDLQRSKWAYHLFQAFCAVFIPNEIAKQDGLTSILRAFKKDDLKKLGEALPVSSQEIHWKWAFRYQWIIYKDKN